MDFNVKINGHEVLKMASIVKVEVFKDKKTTRNRKKYKERNYEALST